MLSEAEHSKTVAKLREQLERTRARLKSEQERRKALSATLAERKEQHAATVAKLRQQLDKVNARVATQTERVKALSAKLAEQKRQERERLVNLRQRVTLASARVAAAEERAKALSVELAELKRREAWLRAGRGSTVPETEENPEGRLDSAQELDPPIVLIASAGSGGSHLAAVLLAGREPFFAGPEANLASRPDLFDGASFELALFKGLLRDEPYFRPVKRKDKRDFNLVPPLVLTNGESYGIDCAAARLELLEVAGWSAMIRNLHHRLVEAGIITGADVLVEHSPSCAASLAAALGEISHLKFVHLVRDPRDSIASMMARRKLAPQFASLGAAENLALTAQQWAFLTAAALRVSDHPGYLRISYESLVSSPDDVLEKLCAHFGFPQAPRRAGGPLLVGPMDRMSGWAWSPTGAVTKNSVGRFKRDLSAAQLKRLTAMRFDFPELEQEVSMEELIERFAAPETAAVARS
jgi:Sulfotransferase family